MNGVEKNLALKQPLWCYYQDGHELPPPIGFDLPSEESLPASKVLCCYLHRMCFFVVVKLTTALSKLVELWLCMQVLGPTDSVFVLFVTMYMCVVIVNQ